MSRHRPTRTAVPSVGRRRPSPVQHNRHDPASGEEHDRTAVSSATTAGRTGPGGTLFADTSADFDGSATNDLVCTIGLLLGSCRSERQLALIAKELAAYVERRDAGIVIEQLRWRLDRLDAYHQKAREHAKRSAP